MGAAVLRPYGDEQFLGILRLRVWLFCAGGYENTFDESGGVCGDGCGFVGGAGLGASGVSGGCEDP